MIHIKLANEGDAGALSRLAESTFRDAFGQDSEQDDIDFHCRENFGTTIQLREILDPGYITMLAFEEKELVGYAQLRPRSTKECVGGEHPVELYRLYVTSLWHGRGAAQSLMSEVLDFGVTQQADNVWLGVWEKNPRAIAFYRKYGFEVVGEHTFVVGRDPQRDLIMSVDVSIRAG